MTKRRKFDCTEQRINDVMKAIEVIRPVISLIRTLNVKEKERLMLLEKSWKDQEDLTKLKGIIGNISNDEMKQELNLIVDKYSNRILAMKDKIEKLEPKLLGIRGEIDEYFEYANSFYYVGAEEIVEDLLMKAIDEECSIEDFFSILIIFKNECIEECEELECKSAEYANDTKDAYRKHILKNIGDYDKNDICSLIKES